MLFVFFDADHIFELQTILFTFVSLTIEKGPQREFPAGGLYFHFLEFG